MWFKRLGHLNFESLYQFSQQGTVKCFLRLPRIKYICDIYHCCGKQTQKSFLKSVSYTVKPLEIVHSHVCGPFKPTSISGATYFVIFINNFSCKIWVHSIKTKNQILIQFKHFKMQPKTFSNIRFLIL